MIERKKRECDSCDWMRSMSEDYVINVNSCQTIEIRWVLWMKAVSTVEASHEDVNKTKIK